MSGSVTEWWRQRVSSVLLIPLTLWLLWAGASLASMDYSASRAFMGQPLNAIAAALLALMALYHAQAGITTIVEDYVPGEGFSKFLILITRLGCGVGVLASIAAAFMLLTGA
jgi:succinate dehydrogenase / fumarate reductase membrane anchor subunit